MPSPTPVAPSSASSSSAVGAELTFETFAAEDAAVAALRLREREQTLLRVIDGILSLTVGGAKARLLGIGDEAIVSAGAPHRMASACGQTKVVMGFRPAPARR
jgi:hypothetical protein